VNIFSSLLVLAIIEFSATFFFASEAVAEPNPAHTVKAIRQLDSWLNDLDVSLKTIRVTRARNDLVDKLFSLNRDIFELENQGSMMIFWLKLRPLDRTYLKEEFNTMDGKILQLRTRLIEIQQALEQQGFNGPTEAVTSLADALVTTKQGAQHYSEEMTEIDATHHVQEIENSLVLLKQSRNKLEIVIDSARD